MTPDHARQIDEGRYPPDEGTLEVLASAMDHVASTSRALGVSADVPDAVRQVLERGIAAGHGDRGVASLAEVIAAGARERDRVPAGMSRTTLGRRSRLEGDAASRPRAVSGGVGWCRSGRRDDGTTGSPGAGGASTVAPSHTHGGASPGGTAGRRDRRPRDHRPAAPARGIVRQ